MVWCITAANEDEDSYTVETEDGRVFNVEWYAGFSDWDVDDKVIPTVDSGFGFMVYCLWEPSHPGMGGGNYRGSYRQSNRRLVRKRHRYGMEA
jgi:hypothetical protein